DFLSVGFSFDLPIFTGRRQDQQVVSATQELESMRLERVLVLRALRADFAAVLAEHQRLQERLELYSNRLLRETDEQAEASLQAYTNDDGDFAEAVRARIADLNARIDVFSIEVSLLSLQARANYLLAGERPATETVGASNHE
ncbi:MAG: TolC family protein, partial [Pseudomonadales bacterium]